MPAASPSLGAAKDAFPFRSILLLFLPSISQLAFQEFKEKVTARPPFSSPRGTSHFSFGGKDFISLPVWGCKIVASILVFVKTLLLDPRC